MALETIDTDSDDVTPTDLFGVLSGNKKTEESIRAVYEIDVDDVLGDAIDHAGDGDVEVLQEKFEEYAANSVHISCPEEHIARLAAVQIFNEEFSKSIRLSSDTVRSRKSIKTTSKLNWKWEVEIVV